MGVEPTTSDGAYTVPYKEWEFDPSISGVLKPRPPLQNSCASTVNQTRGLKIFSLALSQLSYRSWLRYEERHQPTLYPLEENQIDEYHTIYPMVLQLNEK